MKLKEYLELPYSVLLRKDADGDYVARVAELPGCAAHGRTLSLAMKHLAEAKELWIRDCLEAGDPVPVPDPEGELPSGKWIQRVPRTLHGRLTKLAKREGVSLNQFVTSVLAEAAGRRSEHPMASAVLFDKAQRVSRKTRAA